MLVERILPLLPTLSADERTAYQKRQADLADYFRYRHRPANATQGNRILGDSQATMGNSAALEKIPTAETAKRFGATFDIGPDERFYGLGGASARRLQLRGFAYRNYPEYRGAGGIDETARWEQVEQPTPLLLSSNGWAVFVNTTWLHYFDVGRYEPDKMFFWGPGGELDFYLIVGENFPRLLDRYTQITGRPIVLPLWGYGLMHICNIAMNQFEVLDDGKRYRQQKIPCDMIALEPGWMDKFYDFSHEKDWSHAQFETTWQPREWTFQGRSVAWAISCSCGSAATTT